jgi:Cytochrome C oxidase, cbb3-type, subunit III
LTSSRIRTLLERRAGRLAICATLLLGGCRLDMHVQPRYNPYDPSEFFADGRSERPPVAGTVARSEIVGGPEEVVSTGMRDNREIDAFPFPVTRVVLDRGRERYNIFCAPCHGWTGDGDGIIVQRGFRPPPSYHIDRLRQAPVGHFFSVISSGFGAMYPYGYRILPRDRWAIIAYIRALQLSRQATIDDVPQVERSKLLGETP